MLLLLGGFNGQAGTGGGGTYVGAGGVAVGGSAGSAFVPKQEGNTVSGGGFTPLDWLPLVPPKKSEKKRPRPPIPKPQPKVFGYVAVGGVVAGGTAAAAEGHPQVAHKSSCDGGVVVGGSAKSKFISPVLIAPRDAEDLMVLSLLLAA